MATVINDTVEDLGAIEENGAVVEFRRRAIVTGLNSTNSSVITEIASATGMPQVNAPLPGLPHLYLMRRDIRMIPGDTKTASVELVYATRGSRNDSINFIFRGGTTLQQVTTEVDAFGNQVTVQHTYPGGDPDYPNETIVQGGSASVLVPQSTRTAIGQLRAPFPESISRLWTGALNEVAWYGDPVGTWMCSSVTYECINLSDFRWEFTFEFQYDASGWQPQVVFTDRRDGKPPPGLVAGVGYKEFIWYPTMNFNSLFRS